MPPWARQPWMSIIAGSERRVIHGGPAFSLTSATPTLYGNSVWLESLTHVPTHTGTGVFHHLAAPRRELLYVPYVP